MFEVVQKLPLNRMLLARGFKCTFSATTITVWSRPYLRVKRIKQPRPYVIVDDYNKWTKTLYYTSDPALRRLILSDFEIPQQPTEEVVI